VVPAAEVDGRGGRGDVMGGMWRVGMGLEVGF